MRRSKQDQASPRFAFAETLTLSTGTRAEPQRPIRPKGTPRVGRYLRHLTASATHRATKYCPLVVHRR